jgi:hypothetical protein
MGKEIDIATEILNDMQDVFTLMHDWALCLLFTSNDDFLMSFTCQEPLYFEYKP